MPVVNGNRITAPVSLNDVNTVLGTGYDDVGKLIRNTNFTFWAKYKPFSASGKYSGVTENDVISANCGLNPPSVSSTIDATKSKTWTVNKPSGGTTSPYRLHDFKDYYDDAEIKDKYSLNKTVNLPNDSANTINIATNGVQSDYAIGINDLGILSDYYLGIEITYTYSGNTSSKYMTSSTKIGSGSKSITIPVSSLPVKANGVVYDYYVFASSTSQTTFSDTISGSYYPLPWDTINDMKGTITINGNLEPQT